jgi:hypothetical protein
MVISVPLSDVFAGVLNARIDPHRDVFTCADKKGERRARLSQM